MVFDFRLGRVYKTQIPVVEQAIETAALMLGTDKSRGYCHGDDLCGLPGRSEPRKRGPISAATVHVTVLQIPSRANNGRHSCTK